MSAVPAAVPAAACAPVIVLTYAHAGAERLRSLLARHPDLVCTSGTGILPLCEQAATAWRNVDGRSAGQPSALAVACIRALASSIITALCAQEGKRRWCEIATAQPSSAETFMQLYPGTKVLCLHRSCADFASAAVHASPWGLAGGVFAPFTSAHPASTVAALIAYWVAHTGPLIEFERAHPDACHRVRYEDLASGSDSSLLGFLGLEDGLEDGQACRSGPANLHIADPGQGTAEPRSPIPVEQIPPPLLAHANALLATLGYAPL